MTEAASADRRGSVIVSACQQISALGCGLDALLAYDPEGLVAGPDASLAVGSDYDFTRASGIAPSAVTRQMDELTRVTVACSRLALGPDPIPPGEETAIFLGGGFGCHASNQDFLDTLVDQGGRFVKPVVFRNTVSNAAAGHLAIVFGATGTNTVVNSGMAAGLQAMAMASDELRWERSRVALTGASDWVGELVVRRYSRQTSGTGADAPPLMDGAAMFVLRRTDGREQGWRLLGYDLARVGQTHATEQLRALIEGALRRSGVGPGAIGNVVLSSGWVRGWARGGGPADLGAIVTHLLAGVACPPRCETTALVPMLALAEALARIPAGQPMGIFVRGPRVQPEPGGVLVFVGVGTDGNAVALTLDYWTAGSSRGAP